MKFLFREVEMKSWLRQPMLSPLIYKIYFVLITDKTKLRKLTEHTGKLFKLFLELPPGYQQFPHSERGLQEILTTDQKASMTFFWTEQLQ